MANITVYPVRISSRKRIFSYPYPRRKHNRQLVSIPTSTKSMSSFPKFLLSNVRSMVNKIDEIQGVLSTNECDIFVLTESWLTSKVSDNLITIPDYKHIRKDRLNDQRGGGICTYLKRSISFLHLHDFDDPCLETQWFLLKPNRLPRGINSIIIATIYHPPGNDDHALRNHIFQYLDRALNRHPNSEIVLLGDFNQFNPGYLCSSFKLKKAVHSATRGNNTLDQIYTTLSDFYDPATILPPNWQIRPRLCSSKPKNVLCK